jgi:hypothetical protein
LLTPTERAAAELEIALAPNAWPVIGGTGVPARRGQHAKSEKEDLTDAERREIQKLVVALEAEG